MTDDTVDPTPGTPVEPFGTDTPGPDATPEQDAAVAGLLALLRSDDVSMPDDVVRRLDAVLAEERRTRPQRLATTGAAALGGDDEGPGSAGDGLATVLPMAEARTRRQRDLGWLTWLGGVAAAVIVVGGGVAVLGHGNSSSTSTAASSASAEAASGGVTGTRTAQTQVLSTHADYTPTTLTARVGTLLSSVPAGFSAADAASGGPSPVDAPVTASSEASSGSTAPVEPQATTAPGTSATQTAGGTSSVATPKATAPLTLATLGSCMTGLGLPGVVPLVIDHGTFEGKPADIVVVPTDGDPSTVDVYVLHPGCASSEPLVYEFATVRR